jgi:hypothetical protein
MLYRYILVALLVSIAAGCRSVTLLERDTWSVDDYAALNRLLAVEEVLVRTRDGENMPVIGIQVGADSTSWFVGRRELVVVSTEEVVQITRLDRDRGRAQGAGLGALSGMGVGVVAIGTTLGDDCCLSVSPLLVVGVGAAIGLLPGVILGAMVGEKEGAKDVFLMEAIDD